MDSINQYLTYAEAGGERAYLCGYQTEASRLHDGVRLAALSEHERTQQLAFWAHLAHTAGVRARARYLATYHAEPVAEIEAEAPVVERVVEHRRYSTAKAVLIWHNGPGIRLYRTERGAFFRTDRHTDGPGYKFGLVTIDEALRLYQVEVREAVRVLPFEEAFPGYVIEEG
ncbi:MAG: hypothetical protein M3P51_11315 [Chloroflexota bacterium]|nr:hypothetical protein [Chloroflexota bacterium]